MNHKPAYPLPYNADGIRATPDARNPANGLTRRELFAAMAMQAIITTPNSDGSMSDYAIYAIKAADALIAELDDAKN